MNAYSYYDIFSTKGVEYLVVIAFLIVVVPLWIMLTKPVKVKTELLSAVSGFSSRILNIPRGLFYNKNHTWSFLEKSGKAKIGLDDFLLHVTGGVSVDYLKEKGEKINKGDLIARIHHQNRELKITSPISGTVQSINQKLSEGEGKINEDPYGKGWICKVEPENWKKETEMCMMAEEAKAWTEAEVDRCKDFLANSLELPETLLQAGGELVDFPLAEMSEEVWNKFQAEFLTD